MENNSAQNSQPNQENPVPASTGAPAPAQIGSHLNNFINVMLDSIAKELNRPVEEKTDPNIRVHFQEQKSQRKNSKKSRNYDEADKETQEETDEDDETDDEEESDEDDHSHDSHDNHRDRDNREDESDEWDALLTLAETQRKLCKAFLVMIENRYY